MIRIQQIKLGIEQNEKALSKKAAKVLKIKEIDIKSISIVKRSLDARKKSDISYSYVIDVEVIDEYKVWKNCGNKQAEIVSNKSYSFPTVIKNHLQENPIIVGMGPAGLFCAYFLAKAGLKPVILERGKDVDERQKDVETFWNGGNLNTESNVQFGEGGAGTFSDGKLNTLVKDKYGRNKEVLRLFVQFGAPEEILYESKPHIGTDILRDVVKNMRQEIIQLGGQVFFQSQVTDLCLADGKVCGVEINGDRKMHSSIVVLAIGHSARNTFEMLYNRKVPMEAKPFAVGFRVEHSQNMINESQYGEEYSHHLPAAPYKVAAKTRDGRGVYSFCMCPGGYVVNASSEQGKLCVNGMSYSGRDGHNSNSAIIVTVTQKDFYEDHPLAGMHFQREVEEKAFQAGQGKVPVQTYGSFKTKVYGVDQAISDNETFEPSVKGQYVFTDITGILPHKINEDIVEGMEQFGKMIHGFNKPDTLLSAVESRTSSPIRIIRGDGLESEVKGLFPCGEGAGYAGGITSAAMDGIKIAEAVACLAKLD
ncbi:MAG TPA: NAD(P)/FAD-dependent oxidoreductase [Lachnospiraceae bacterium]|nr:NAD(P)/FAD-dependent oxidoreductase [Lachnospiraceae bacterium]